ATGGFNEHVARRVLKMPSLWLRVWGVRFLGEQPALAEACTEDLEKLAEKEPTVEVRLELASAARRFRPALALACVHSLMKHPEDLADPCLPLMIWLATEPLVMQFTNEFLGWMAHTGDKNRLIADYLWPRAMRRIATT